MEKKTERTIYLKDLLFAVLYRWKWILAATLIGAILLGVLELLTGGGAVSLNATSLTEENQIKIQLLQENLEYTEHAIDSQTAYMEDSVLMRLDPYGAFIAGARFFAIPKGDNKSTFDLHVVILQNYNAGLINNGVAAALAEKMGLQEWAVKELVSCEITGNGDMHIAARGRTMEEAQSIADAYCSAVKAQTAAVTEAMGEHTLKEIPYSFGPQFDTGLYDRQNTARTKLTTLHNNRIAAKTELDRLLPTELMSGGAKPVLFAAVGAVLGACLAAGIAWICHISSSKVYSARVLKDRTGLRILGCVNSNNRFGFVTEWFRKLEGRTAYGKTDVAAVNIRNHCENIKRLLILGNYDQEEIKPLVEALEKDGIACTVCGDPAVSAQVLEALPGCDGVVLVETCGRSRYDSVLWEQETVVDYKKELLGCVLIGG